MTGQVAGLIRAHAATAPYGFEVGGELKIDGDKIVAYEPRPNGSPEQLVYQPTRHPPPGWIHAHTHPVANVTTPSAGDLAAMRADRLSELAIFTPKTDAFIVARLDTSRPSGFVAVPVEVESVEEPVVITIDQRAELQRSVDYQGLLRMAATPLDLDTLDAPTALAAELSDGTYTLTASGGRRRTLVVQRAAAARAMAELLACIPQPNA
jgi:hypothetical protein